MRDDDDLPVLNAVVRGGDRDVILSTRLGLALDPARDVHPRPPLTGRGSAADDVVTDHVARIDLGRREEPSGPPLAGSLDGPIGIDARRGLSGSRVSRGPLASGAVPRTRSADVGRDADGDGDDDEELDDTLVLDAPPARSTRLSRDAGARRAPHVAVVPSTRLPRSAVAANDRGIGPAGARRDAARIERLVDEVVERHVATLRRDVRRALERALADPDTRHA